MASPRVIENNDTFNDSEERADGDDEQEEHDVNKKIHLAEGFFFIKHVFKFGGPLLHDTMADIRVHLPFRSLNDDDDELEFNDASTLLGH